MKKKTTKTTKTNETTKTTTKKSYYKPKWVRLMNEYLRSYYVDNNYSVELYENRLIDKEFLYFMNNENKTGINKELFRCSNEYDNNQKKIFSILHPKYNVIEDLFGKTKLNKTNNIDKLYYNIKTVLLSYTDKDDMETIIDGNEQLKRILFQFYNKLKELNNNELYLQLKNNYEILQKENTLLKEKYDKLTLRLLVVLNYLEEVTKVHNNLVDVVENNIIKQNISNTINENSTIINTIKDELLNNGTITKTADTNYKNSRILFRYLLVMFFVLIYGTISNSIKFIKNMLVNTYQNTINTITNTIVKLNNKRKLLKRRKIENKINKLQNKLDSIKLT